jgi:hypothetical protein
VSTIDKARAAYGRLRKEFLDLLPRAGWTVREFDREARRQAVEHFLERRGLRDKRVLAWQRYWKSLPETERRRMTNAAFLSAQMYVDSEVAKAAGGPEPDDWVVAASDMARAARGCTEGKHEGADRISASAREPRYRCRYCRTSWVDYSAATE